MSIRICVSPPRVIPERRASTPGLARRVKVFFPERDGQGFQVEWISGQPKKFTIVNRYRQNTEPWEGGELEGDELRNWIAGRDQLSPIAEYPGDEEPFRIVVAWLVQRGAESVSVKVSGRTGLVDPKTMVWEPGPGDPEPDFPPSAVCGTGGRAGPVPKPKRSGVTDLSEGELLILDNFAVMSASARGLFADSYAVHLNVPYHHGIADLQVGEVLKKFEARGLLEPRESEEGKVFSYGMTDSGGTVWEAERMPVWERFVQHIGFWDQDDVLRWQVRCTDESVGRAFAEGVSEVRVRSPERGTFFYWKRWDRIIVIELPTEKPERAKMDDHEVIAELERLEELRTWWQDLQGLQKFL